MLLLKSPVEKLSRVFLFTVKPKTRANVLQHRNERNDFLS